MKDPVFLEKNTFKKIDAAIQTLEPLIIENPDAYLAITLSALSGENISLASNVWRNLNASLKGAWALGKSPLKNVLKLGTEAAKATWKNPIATFKSALSSGTQAVKKTWQDPTAPLQTMLNTFLDPVLIVVDALTTNPDLVLKNKRFKTIVTTPKLWQAVIKQRTKIADYIVTNVIFPDAQSHKAQISTTKSFLSEIFHSLAKTIPNQKTLVQEIMKHASIILDPKELDDSIKITNLFGLLDKVIEFIKAAPHLQKSLNNNKVIAGILAPYIPANINVKKIVNAIINPNTLTTLEKVYIQYRDSKHHTIGLLKAGATILQCAELRSLLTHVVGKFIKTKLLNFVPNFIRRKHANKIVNDKLAKRQNIDHDLSKLCKTGIEIDVIATHTLNGCFKGLRIAHSLNNFTIQNFNFKDVTFGTVNQEFSLADSKVSNTNFQNVKFKGTTINLSGSIFDEKSFLSLLPRLKKARAQNKEIKITNKINITSISKNLQNKIQKSGFDLTNFEFIAPLKTQIKEPLEKSSQTKRKKQKNKLSFVQSLKKARRAAQVIKKRRISGTI